jgi:hypothetical protein
MQRNLGWKRFSLPRQPKEEKVHVGFSSQKTRKLCV